MKKNDLPLKNILNECGLTDQAEAEVIAGWILNKNRAWVLAHPEAALSVAQVKKIAAACARRRAGEPLAHILGRKEFFGLNFSINRHTLVPRPETETLVEEILKNKRIARVADIGAGSGCIAIALAKHRWRWKIFAGDISGRALRVARQNAKKHAVNIVFKKGDLLAPFNKIKLDAIVANLPYLPKSARKNLAKKPETRGLAFEPAGALFADKNGLALFEKLFQQIARREQKPRWVYLETGFNQARAISTLAQSILGKITTKIKPDLAGRERVLIIRF